MSAPPRHYPFSPYLASIDPLQLYPDGHLAVGESSPGPRYEFPYLRPSDIDRLVAYLARGGVVDPLNIVFWGRASLGPITQMLDQLSSWIPTLLSAPLWGLAEVDGDRVKLETARSLQNTRWPTSIKPLLLLTQVVNSWARHHVRIMTPFHAGGPWGTIAVAGAHTESITPQRAFPYFWHRVGDWGEARDMLVRDVRAVLGDEALDTRIFPTEGRWQGRHFDGRVAFVRVS
jgi:hypothetical protein